MSTESGMGSKLSKDHTAMIAAAISPTLSWPERDKFAEDISDELRLIGSPTKNQVRAAITKVLSREK